MNIIILMLRSGPFITGLAVVVLLASASWAEAQPARGGAGNSTPQTYGPPTDLAGDIMVLQSGEIGQGAAGVYIVHWDGRAFTTRSMFLGTFLDDPGFSFEKAAFAPVDIESLPQ